LLGRKNLKKLRVKLYRKQKNIATFIKERRTIKILPILRNYAAIIVVISSVFLVCATNFAAGHKSSGFLFGYFGTNENYDSPLQGKFFLETNKITNVALAPLAEAKTAPNPQKTSNGNQANTSMVIQGQALVAKAGPIRKDPEENGGVNIYKVKSGDTVGSIAASHHVTVNTILWANALDNPDSIMPGDKIFILPVSGLNYVIKDGDTLDSIAKKYKAQKDKIISFNSLPANGKVSKGEEIIIPDGQKETPTKTAHSFNIAIRPYKSFNSTGKILRGKSGSGHHFPYGYCTWYVAQRKYIPWGGNAGTWLYHAKASGYATGRKPRVGSIMVSSDSWWGHVAYVEKIKGSLITISEMNYKAWGRKDYRTINYHSRSIKGFIY